jgi:hypothetical protein
MMSLELQTRHDVSVFDHLFCPTCGCMTFVEIRHEGTFCKECNTQVNLRELNEEKIQAVFDCEPAWNLHHDELNRTRLPDEGRAGYAPTDLGRVRGYLLEARAERVLGAPRATDRRGTGRAAQGAARRGGSPVVAQSFFFATS